MADYNTRQITEKERLDICDEIKDITEKADHLDMWYVLYAVTDVFNILDIRRAFFDERMDMEHYIAELIKKFDAQGRRYYIHSNGCDSINKDLV